LIHDARTHEHKKRTVYQPKSLGKTLDELPSQQMKNCASKNISFHADVELLSREEFRPLYEMPDLPESTFTPHITITEK
jgi:hypothetical protein